MTDAEADAWFLNNADFKMTHTAGMTTYQLWRRGKTARDEETVGFAIPEAVQHPEPLEVQRFLVRWFASAHGV